jgi:hypothetical protein
MTKTEHPLAIQSTTIQKDLNINKYVGQVVLGILVTLSVRYVVTKWDQWTLPFNKKGVK